jgi:hypothetical protein
MWDRFLPSLPPIHDSFPSHTWSPPPPRHGSIVVVLLLSPRPLYGRRRSLPLKPHFTVVTSPFLPSHTSRALLWGCLARRRSVGSGSSNASPPCGRGRGRRFVGSRVLPSTDASVSVWIVGMPHWCRAMNCSACQYTFLLTMFSFDFHRRPWCAGSFVGICCSLIPPT